MFPSFWSRERQASACKVVRLARELSATYLLCQHTRTLPSKQTKPRCTVCTHTIVEVPNYLHYQTNGLENALTLRECHILFLSSVVGSVFLFYFNSALPPCILHLSVLLSQTLSFHTLLSNHAKFIYPLQSVK
jgi:hypothetical protein